MLTPRLGTLVRKACHGVLLVAIGWAGSALCGAGDAQAAPYCVLRKPQFGAPANCFQFYLADLARIDGGARAGLTTAGACGVTPMGQREGWSPDTSFPLPLPSWSAGDSAIGVVSPYHKDLYACRAAQSGTSNNPPASGGGAGGGVNQASLCSAPGGGCQLRQIVRQPEQRDAQGRLTAEAALIHVLQCPTTGTRYVYQYLNRRAFRVVQPPNWGQALGGGDFATCEQANTVAARDGATPQPPVQTAGYYVYVLKDIGLVAATQQIVSTRPVCHWSGGGPRPCTAPASVIGSLGGPYPTEDAARADMRTKLDCQRGHWGTFVGEGNNRAWLQNNITGADCRSMKQL